MFHNWLNVWLALLTAIAWGSCPADSSAAEKGVGFLLPRADAERLGTESDMAREAAARLTSATVLVPDAKGRFVDRQGRDVSLDRFRVIWCHGGDSALPQEPVLEPATVDALRQFVSGGHGLWLSGSAAVLVDALGIDTLRAAPLRVGQDYAQSGLVPLAADHPAFRGLDLDQGTLWMSSVVFPAFAEFHLASESADRRILARTPGGPDCPLVEYQLGQGRVVVLGWRLDPLYPHAAAGYRRNFECLAANLIRYLGDALAW